MKSKLFTHKFFVVLCISVAALLGLSFLARATIVNNRFEQMAVDQKYRLKPSADGQFLIQFQDDKNGNFYATVGLFQGGYWLICFGRRRMFFLADYAWNVGQ